MTGVYRTAYYTEFQGSFRDAWKSDSAEAALATIFLSAQRSLLATLVVLPSHHLGFVEYGEK